MPTGYTAAIEKGISFRDFVLRCARGMGACIMQRDDSSDALPKTQQPSDYHAIEIKRIEKEIVSVKAMTDDDIEKKMRLENKKREEDEKKRIAERRALEEKYNKMLEKVTAWIPPTPDHQNLKKFMTEQIEESIKWDCGSYKSEPLVVSADKWREERLHDLTTSLAYHTKNNQEEILRTNECNKWITDLYENLKQY